MATCARRGCQTVITHDVHYAIFNEPSTPDSPQLYCCGCGRKIIEYNQQQHRFDDPMRLRFTVRPFVNSSEKCPL